jgi:hypothetical protein
MLLEETTVPVSSWFFKVEAGSNVNAREVALSSSKEGHSRPGLNTWQSYPFPLATLASGSTLDLSAMDLFIVFPNFADAAGASYLVDNFKIVNVDNSGGVGDGNGPELLINGGFEGGAEAWTLPGTDNVATEDGNSFFEVDVTSAGDAFAVNLSQGMTLIPDTAYVVSFKAKASVARTMLAGLGLYAQPFHSAAETVPLTTEWQTFTYTISTLNDNDGAPFGDDISRVLFDMGAEVGMVSIDDVSVKLLDAE